MCHPVSIILDSLRCSSCSYMLSCPLTNAKWLTSCWLVPQYFSWQQHVQSNSFMRDSQSLYSIDFFTSRSLVAPVSSLPVHASLERPSTAWNNSTLFCCWWLLTAGVFCNSAMTFDWHSIFLEDQRSHLQCYKNWGKSLLKCCCQDCLVI